MDDEFDRAVQALAALQIKHGIPSILLSVRAHSGDVVATIHRPEDNSFALYARVHRDTKQLVRLRS